MDQELRLSGEQLSIEQIESINSDRILAKSITEGDMDAWGRFFDRYSTWVYRYAFYHLDRNHADAEDLCSDILLTAAKNINTYDSSRGSLDSWLSGVARHRLSLFCRKRKKEYTQTDLTDIQAGKAMDDITVITDKIAVHDTVNKTLAILSERQASALIGKYVEGYSTDELARIGNTTPKAMESLLTRARNSFRTIYNELLKTEGRGR